MKSKSAEKIKMKSYDDLFGTAESAAGEGETVTSVPLNQLHTFKDHPFRVLDDEKMQKTVDSVKRYGVLIPGIVCPYPKGGYEVVAGHRRWRACELAALEEMPVLIRNLNDDEATIVMVDGKLVAEDLEDGFDQGAREAIHEYLAEKGIDNGQEKPFIARYYVLPDVHGEGSGKEVQYFPDFDAAIKAHYWLPNHKDKQIGMESM